MRKNKILIIEDDLLLCQKLSDLMTSEGHKVEIAHSGAKGYEIIQSKKIDLVLLAIGLPDVNGLALLSKFRHLNEKLPIIIITAREDIGSSISAIREGAFDYFLKPLDFHALLTCINKALMVKLLKKKQKKMDKLKTISEVAVAANHHLNQQLAVIVGNTQLLQTLKKPLNEEKISELTSDILSATTKMQKILARLNSVVKPETSFYVGKVRMLDIKKSQLKRKKAKTGT